VVSISVQVEGVMGLTWSTWQALVAQTDALGFAGLFCSDHFVFRAAPDHPSLDVMTALTYAASHTERVHFGALVTPISFREPVMLARQALALDDLSGGRMILGVGAGWNEREHRMFGYPLGDIPTRMARFTEALAVISALLRSDEPVTFAGQFYQLNEAALLPRPQRPGGPRLMIGGSGPRRTLPLVAKYADEWNASGMFADDVRERNALLDTLLVQAGRRPRDVKRTMMKLVLCGRNTAEYERRLVGLRRQAIFADLPTDALVEKARTDMKGIVGTPAEVAAQLRAYADAGIEEIMAQSFAVDDLEGWQVLADEVLPLLA